MAEVTKSGLVGAVGQLVFYTMNGKNYVRSKPRAQSARTKKKLQPITGAFGTVSSISSRMASVLRAELNCPFPLQSYNTLRGWMLRQYRSNANNTQWQLSVAEETCGLNALADLRQIFSAGISVTDNGSGRIVVDIDAFNPAKDIKAPAGAGSVNFKLLCAGLPDPAGRGDDAELAISQYAFNLTDKTIPAFEMKLTTKAKKNHLLCLVLAVEFRAGNKQSTGIINMPAFLPAAAIGLGRRK